MKNKLVYSQSKEAWCVFVSYLYNFQLENIKKRRKQHMRSDFSIFLISNIYNY